MQNGSSGSITLDEWNPVAVNVFLEFVYTLCESSLKLEWVDEEDFKKGLEIYDSLPSECDYLVSVIAVAVEFDYHDLADLAEEKLKERLIPLESHAPSDKKVLQTLVSGLVKILYSHNDIATLQTYRNMVVRMITVHWDQILLSDTTEELMLAYPKMGWDLTRLTIPDLQKMIQKKEDMIEDMRLDVPKKKRKKYENSDSRKTKRPRHCSSEN
jgi:hypothetical protein